jgi:NTP pyrophosphatase (non-canonical NTP hydrolase)
MGLSIRVRYHRSKEGVDQNMTFDEYQILALRTNLKKDDKLMELLQQVLGLGDESGEVLAIFKKWIRDDNADFEKLNIESIKKELGDILWYIAVVANDVGLSMGEIADLNIKKLADRQNRGVLGGSGDKR